MLVLATAGHVDHGKSRLLRALTGMEPDRFAEERRRGMTLDLGFVWCDLPGGGEVAFVDVPGHERFVPTMLAGVGSVPAVLLVVAADEGWMPQTEEHVTAVRALAVRHGVVAVTRSDLADPQPAMADVHRRLAGTGLEGAEVLSVSAVSGAGLPELAAALARLASALPASPPGAPVRVWVDRAFSVRGAGTVVTGTLPAGAIAAGDRLSVDPDGPRVRVRAVQSLGRAAQRVCGPARVALNLRDVEPAALPRGSVLVDPDGWTWTGVLDVRLHEWPAPDLPRAPLLHVGSTALTALVRPLDGWHARLRLDRPLPLHVGDRVLLRDPGSRRLTGATVLDPAPPPLRRRGAASERAAALAGVGTGPGAGGLDLAGEVARRGLARVADLRRAGLPVEAATDGVVRAGEWLVAGPVVAQWRRRLAALVADRSAADPLAAGPSELAACRHLQLPDRTLLAVAVEPPLALRGGCVVDLARASAVEPELAAALDALRAELAAQPFAAPEASRLDELGLTPARVAAGARLGHLIALPGRVVLLPGADAEAACVLGRLQPGFTVSQARRALRTSRRVAVPLLEHLDRTGRTRRGADGLRRVVAT